MPLAFVLIPSMPALPEGGFYSSFTCQTCSLLNACLFTSRHEAAGIDMISLWSPYLVRKVLATCNRKVVCKGSHTYRLISSWLKKKSEGIFLHHFLYSEKDVEKMLISKWVLRISCHCASLNMKEDIPWCLSYLIIVK